MCKGSLDAETCDRNRDLTPLLAWLTVWQSCTALIGDLKMAHIDYFFATLSPYAYLGRKPAGRKLRQTTGRDYYNLSIFDYRFWAATWLRATAQGPGTRSRQEYRAMKLPLRQETGIAVQTSSPRIGQPTARLHPMRFIAAQNEGGDVGKLCQLFMTRRLRPRNVNIAEDEVRPRLP